MACTSVLKKGPPRRAGPGRLGLASVGAGCAAHLQGSRVVLHLRQPLPDLPVGHSAAQGIVRALQKLQLLLMLLQGLEVATWRAGRLQQGRAARSTGLPPLSRVPPSPAPAVDVPTTGFRGRHAP